MKSLGSIGVVTFGIRLILETFHCSGKRFNLMDSLTIWNGTENILNTDLEIFRGILSWPV